MENSSTYFVIRHLRNAVSHAHFSIVSKTQDFQFWDHGKNAPKSKWICNIANAVLFVFVNKLAQISAPLSFGEGADHDASQNWQLPR
jgi:hypothetical protein